MSNEKKKARERRQTGAAEAAGAELHLKSSPDVLGVEYPSLFDLRGSLDQDLARKRNLERMRQVLMGDAARIEKSGVRAAQEVKADPAWFQSWAKKDLPDLLAQSQLKAMRSLSEDKDRKENMWSERLRRNAGGLVSGIILAVLSVLIAWAMGIVGFK